MEDRPATAGGAICCPRPLCIRPSIERTARAVQRTGSWGWFAIIAALVVFNTALGEEFLFRGYLLPRMNGQLGRRDWLANGVLFAGYHLHMPWIIPTGLLDTFILSYPSKRYRSTLISIAVHSAQSILVLGLVHAGAL
jgi:membrane protease YdiL (CAAX protease family)